MRRPKRLKVIVATVVAAGTATLAGTHFVGIGCGATDAFACVTPVFPSPPPAGSANIWVDTNGGTCVDNASPVSYNDAQACTWDAANDTCDNGDSVGVQSGSYGTVALTGSNSRTSMCTFTVASGTATMGQFNNGEIGADTGADWITVVGPITANEFDSDQTANVVIDGWNVDHGKTVALQPFHVEATQGAFTLRNSQIHGVMNANAMTYLSGSGPWVFDHNDFYDSLDNTGGAIHTECIYATSVSNFTFTRNHLYSCATEDIFITGSELATNWDVENNIFEHPLGPNANALAFRSGSSPSPSPDGYILKFNTFGREAGIQINPTDNQVTANGFTVIGNFFATQSPCGMANTTYDRNAFITGQQCGTNAIQDSITNYNAGFVDPHNATGSDGSVSEAAGNYYLITSSVLKNQAGTTLLPSIDRDGTSRPQGTNADIGAYEFIGG